jgi:hypothetical protein
LSEQVVRDGLPKPNFHGFMADATSTITMQFIKFMVATQMFFWKAKNVGVFTIGRKTYEYTPKNDIFCF